MVVSVDPTTCQTVVETASGAQEVDLDRPPLLGEHGYASTVHSAQGRTVDSVVIHLDTRQQALSGQESWYVAISRARSESLEVTDDAKRLSEAIKKGRGPPSSNSGIGLHDPNRLRFTRVSGHDLSSLGLC